MKKYFLPAVVSFFLLFSVGVLSAYAQVEANYTPLAPLPGTTIQSGDGAGTTNISTYVAGMIKLLVALGAALAVLFAIIGGTQYVAASINPAAKAGALERIQNSLVGLAIILSSYLVLNSINPDLVNFKLELPPVTVRHEVNVTAGGSTIDDAGCPTITTPSVLLNSTESQQLESGATVVFTASDATADVQANLKTLQGESNKLILALPQLNSGIKATVTSAYRPYVYQKHLYEIYDTWVKKDLKNNTNPACAANKTFVGAESTKHFGPNGPGLVANPDGQIAPHTKGTGIDIKLEGIEYGNFTAYGYTDINDFMVHNGIYLSWQGLQNDKVHFNLRSRP